MSGLPSIATDERNFAGCLKRATFGLTHRSKAYLYSITSSARASMVGEW